MVHRPAGRCPSFWWRSPCHGDQRVRARRTDHDERVRSDPLSSDRLVAPVRRWLVWIGGQHGAVADACEILGIDCTRCLSARVRTSVRQGCVVCSGCRLIRRRPRCQHDGSARAAFSDVAAVDAVPASRRSPRSRRSPVSFVMGVLVGGVADGRTARATLESGASLIQASPRLRRQRSAVAAPHL